MLEGFKTVLNGVKDDKKLFKKELIKSLSWLNGTEKEELKQWVEDNFQQEHGELIESLLHSSYMQAS